MKSLEYYMSLPYRLEIIPDAAEGGYGARYPELPGCITCADTLEKVVENAQDAKKEWLIAALEEGVNIPEPQPAYLAKIDRGIQQMQTVQEKLLLTRN